MWGNKPYETTQNHHPAKTKQSTTNCMEQIVPIKGPPSKTNNLRNNNVIITAKYHLRFNKHTLITLYIYKSSKMFKNSVSRWKCSRLIFTLVSLWYLFPLIVVSQSSYSIWWSWPATFPQCEIGYRLVVTELGPDIRFFWVSKVIMEKLADRRGPLIGLFHLSLTAVSAIIKACWASLY